MGIFTNAFTISQYVVDAIYELEFDSLTPLEDSIMLGRCVLYKETDDSYGIAIKTYDETANTFAYKKLNIQPTEWLNNDIISLDGGEIK